MRQASLSQGTVRQNGLESHSLLDVIMNPRTRSLIYHAARVLALVILFTAAVGCASQPEIPVKENVYADRPFERRLIDATRDYVLHVMRAHGTPGLNLAMGYRGELIWEAGFGYADVASRKPMTPETVYHSGSLGKTYTATAIMHLVDRGVIALDDPISDHLPFEVHNPLGDRDIIVRDLLTHRSGLSGGGAKGVWDKPVPLEQALRASYENDASPLLGGTTPFWIGKVGAQYNYSNPGISTLGLIVQTANPDRLSFSDYVQRYIMDPLGMESSQYPPAQHEDHVRPDIWENMSTGYARMGSAWVPSVPLYFSHYAAGGVLAKPADHIRLLTAMMNGGEYDGYRVLEPETVNEMLTPQYEDAFAPGVNIGLVWRLSDYGTRGMSFDHAGGHMFGWRTEGYAWPELGVTLMVATNQWSLPDASPRAAWFPPLSRIGYSTRLPTSTSCPNLTNGPGRCPTSAASCTLRCSGCMSVLTATSRPMRSRRPSPRRGSGRERGTIGTPTASGRA